MHVSVIAHTQINAPAMYGESAQKWMPDESDPDGSALVEFAGRQCYESWARPNPATATNDAYLRNIMSQGHFSVMEHASVSFRISDVSRSLTHELVRHRHLSPSQLSQRFVKVDPESFVIPPLYSDDDVAQEVLKTQWKLAVASYEQLVERYERRLSVTYSPHMARKMAREAARAVLPNMTPTALVLTGNHRSWREFLIKRGSIHADAEIRQLALMVYRALEDLEPGLYQDICLARDVSGTPILVQPDNG